MSLVERLLRLSAAMIVLVVSALPAQAAAPAELDWSEWRSLPVYDAGRVMPLDTMARSIVAEICGRANPRLSPPEDGAGEGSVLFPEGRPRRLSAAELVFSWLAEPERWEDMAFLAAGNESLRRDVLGAALVDRRGNRLKYISPREFEESRGAERRLAELERLDQEARETGRPLALSEADRALEQLNGAYRAYRVLSFDPRQPRMRRVAFLGELMGAVSNWRRELARPLALWQAVEERPERTKLIEGIDQALEQLVGLLEKESFDLTAAVEPAARLCRLTRELADAAEEERERQSKLPDSEMTRERRALANALAAGTAKLARQAHGLRLALYDNGSRLNVVPAIDRFALEQGASGTPPWTALATLLVGSEDVLEGYPAEEVAAVRKAFEQARSAYVGRSSPDRARRFGAAMHDFSEAMRRLSETIEPARRKSLLDAGQQDRDIAGKQEWLAATAYPLAGATEKEVLYNRLDPFLWSWVLTLASMVLLAPRLGILRRTTFFVGVVVLAAGQAFTIAGLVLRSWITGMAPVTNMYETVLFVGGSVAILGLWFALLPIVWPVVDAAWRLTAVSATPRTAASAGLSGDDARWLWRTLQALRLVLIPCCFYVLAVGQFNPGERGPICPLLPVISSGTLGGLAGAVVIWLVGLGLLGLSLWFLPRAILTVPTALLLAPRAVWILLTLRPAEPINRAVARRPFLLAGAGAALVAYLVAYYVPGPVFHRELGEGMTAVLRNNFWLTLHVLTITAGYGAGALAWGLGNISLGYYAMGRYREPLAPSAERTAEGHRPAGDDHAIAAELARRPPAVCATLARYVYQSVQIALLLLAVGTITGAIWADYAWGRYWGWDPKEVWALISVLVYLVVLHGRWAGWTGNFGIAAGAVLGATAIMMAWYGVNFLIRSGLHSYGQSAGGEVYVALCVVANWVFVAFAAARRGMEGGQ